MSVWAERTKVDGAWLQPEDRTAEDQTRALLAAHLGCAVHPYPQFHGIDWYAENGKQVVANVEFKNRAHEIGKYPTVYLSQNKYLTLLLAYLSTSTPGYFLVRWSGGEVRGLTIAEWAPGRLVTAGAAVKRQGEARLAQEPCFEVPVSEMWAL